MWQLHLLRLKSRPFNSWVCLVYFCLSPPKLDTGAIRFEVGGGCQVLLQALLENWWANLMAKMDHGGVTRELVSLSIAILIPLDRLVVPSRLPPIITSCPNNLLVLDPPG